MQMFGSMVLTLAIIIPVNITISAYDISDHIKFDTLNTLAVEVKNEGQNSRWYSGSGIYRHVWIKMMEPIHIKQWALL